MLKKKIYAKSCINANFVHNNLERIFFRRDWAKIWIEWEKNCAMIIIFFLSFALWRVKTVWSFHCEYLLLPSRTQKVNKRRNQRDAFAEYHRRRHCIEYNVWVCAMFKYGVNLNKSIDCQSYLRALRLQSNFCIKIVNLIHSLLFAYVVWIVLLFAFHFIFLHLANSFIFNLGRGFFRWCWMI